MNTIIQKQINEVLKDKFDRSQWVKWKFSDLVQNIKERVTPQESKLTHYIGLKHLDSGSLHIKRYGDTASLKGDKIKIYKGDIIFAKRNAYLKRVAIAEFDAIASAHSMVLRVKPESVLPEFLPFFLLSDQFWNTAIEISVGSLSPTINWRTLKKQEFLLPPKDQQAQIAELLWAMDEVVEGESMVLANKIKLKHSFRKDIFLGFDKNVLTEKSLKKIDSAWPAYKIGKVCEIHNNLRKPINKATRAKIQGQYPYYGPTSILDYISESRIEGEYVLIGEDGDHFLKYSDWSMTQHVTGKFNVNNHAHVLKGTDMCLTKWIYYSLQHRNIIPHITRQGATRYKLNKEGLQDILILLPSIAEQKRLIEKFDTIESGLSIIQSKISSSKNLLQSLINQIF